MIALWIILGCVFGGSSIGAVLIVGAMLHAGKWTLPNSAERKVQSARIQREVAQLRAEAAQQDFFREQIEANRELLRHKSLAELEAAHDQKFQQEILA